MTAMQLSIDLIIWILIYYVDLLKQEDLYSRKYTKWKKTHRKMRDWIEIPYNISDTPILHDFFYDFQTQS